MMTTEVRMRAVEGREETERRGGAGAGGTQVGRHGDVLFDMFGDGQRPVICCLVSPDSAEGTTEFCRELAWELAASQVSSEHRVCLVSGTSLLRGRSLEELVPEQDERMGATVWTFAGKDPGEPAGGAVSLVLPETVEELRQRFSYVLIDGPAVNGSTRAAALAALADRTTLLVRKGSVRRAALRAAHETLLARGARLAGVILLDEKGSGGGGRERA